MLTFYRGLAVPEAVAQTVMDDIRQRGLHMSGRCWSMYQKRPLDPGSLFARADLTTGETRGDHIPEEPAICACGEEDGAAHYAWRHNRSGDDDTPLMIEFKAPVEHVAVDGRDFLYTAFQLGKPERARDVLAGLFGPRVLRYAERAWARKEGQHDIAMCDLAILDPDVIAAHHTNRTVIGGRYRTVFRNAFTVRMPVEPSAIVRVWAPILEPARALPQVSLDDVR